MVIYKRKEKREDTMNYKKYSIIKKKNLNIIKEYLYKNSKKDKFLSFNILTTLCKLEATSMKIMDYHIELFNHRILNPDCGCTHCMKLYVNIKYLLLKNATLTKDGYFLITNNNLDSEECNYINIINHFIFSFGYAKIRKIILLFSKSYLSKNFHLIISHLINNPNIYEDDEELKEIINIKRNRLCKLNKYLKSGKKCKCDKCIIYTKILNNLSEKSCQTIFNEK